MYRLPLTENANCVCRTHLKMKSQFTWWSTVRIYMHKYRIWNPASCGVVKFPLSAVSVQDVERLVHNGLKGSQYISYVKL